MKDLISKYFSDIQNLNKSYYISFAILLIGTGYFFMPLDENKSDPPYSQSIDSFAELNEQHDFYKEADQYCAKKSSLENSSSNNRVIPKPKDQDLSKRYNQIGQKLFVSGDREGAMDYFQKAREIEPNNPTILSNYALASGSQSALYDVCNVDTEHGAKTAVIDANYKLHQTIETTKNEGVYDVNPLSILF